MKSLFLTLIASFLFANPNAQAGFIGSEGGNGSLLPPEYPKTFQYDCSIKMVRRHTTSQGTSEAVMEAKVSMTEKHNNGDYGNGIISLEKLNWAVTSQKIEGPRLPIDFKSQSLLLKFEKIDGRFDVILALDLNQPSLFSRSVLNTHRASRMPFCDSKVIAVDGNLDENADSTDGTFVTIRNSTALEARCERVQ